MGIFEDSVDFRPYSPRLFNHRVKLPPLTKELRHPLYDESQGIADLAIKVYKLAQIEAIKRATTGEEEILTKDLLHSVAQNHLSLVQNFLRALRHDEKEFIGIEEVRAYRSYRSARKSARSEGR